MRARVIYHANVRILTRIKKRDREHLGYAFWWKLLDALNTLKTPSRQLMAKPKLCAFELRRNDWIYSEWNADCPR